VSEAGACIEIRTWLIRCHLLSTLSSKPLQDAEKHSYLNGCRHQKREFLSETALWTCPLTLKERKEGVFLCTTVMLPWACPMCDIIHSPSSRRVALWILQVEIRDGVRVSAGESFASGGSSHQGWIFE